MAGSVLPMTRRVCGVTVFSRWLAFVEGYRETETEHFSPASHNPRSLRRL